MTRSLMFLFLFAWVFPAPSSYGGLLVGTFVESTNPTILKMNQLIDDYNADFGTNLPQIDELVDKIDGENSGSFSEGVLELDNFDFFERQTGGGKFENIFDAVVEFDSDEIDFTSVGFDDLDNAVMGFELVEDIATEFFYYVSKDGNKGWSLWTYMDGFNPVYTDLGNDGFTDSTQGTDLVTGFTRGAVSNVSLDYDPIKNGISNISFWSAVPTNGEVPEPASMAIWALIASGCGAGAIRRRRSKL